MTARQGTHRAPSRLRSLGYAIAARTLRALGIPPTPGDIGEASRAETRASPRAIGLRRVPADFVEWFSDPDTAYVPENRKG